VSQVWVVNRKPISFVFGSPEIPFAIVAFARLHRFHTPINENISDMEHFSKHGRMCFATAVNHFLNLHISTAAKKFRLQF
jgi:hypothetical protein